MVTLKYEDLNIPHHLERAIEVIGKDGLAVYPTDTLYGLGGNFFSHSVLHKIDAFKERSTIPYSIIVHDLEMLSGLVDHVPDFFREIYEKFLPGKFTFLLKAAADIDRDLLKGSEKIGIRVPNSPAILRLTKHMGHPLITTSVNIHGEPPANSPQDIKILFQKRQMSSQLSLLIDKGPLPPSTGSTIVDLSSDTVSIIRQGDDCHKMNVYLRQAFPGSNL